MSAAEPDTFVVIDISFQTPHAVGFDLGQLIAGLVHAGLRPASELPELATVVLNAYVAGLAAEGLPLERAVVEYGFVGSLMLRSGFTSLPYEALGGDAPAMFAERIALTRFIAGEAERIPLPT